MQLESGIPLIAKGRGFRHSKFSSFLKAESGQSVSGSKKDIKALSSYLYANGIKITTRKLSEDSYRLWFI